MFGAENMTQNISAPGNQNGELPQLIMCNHLSQKAVKAETHDASNRGDTSLRHVASSVLLLRQGAFS